MTSTSMSLTGLSRVELTFEQLWSDGSTQISLTLDGPNSPGVELNVLFHASAEGLASWWKLRQQAKAPSYWMMVEAERVERQAAHQRALEFYLHHSKRQGRLQDVTAQVEADFNIIGGIASGSHSGRQTHSIDDGPNYESVEHADRSADRD